MGWARYANVGQHFTEISSDVRKTTCLFQNLYAIVQYFNHVFFARFR